MQEKFGASRSEIGSEINGQYDYLNEELEDKRALLSP